MLLKSETGDSDLYRQLFIYLEQLEDPVRLRTPGTARIELILGTLLFTESSPHTHHRRIR